MCGQSIRRRLTPDLADAQDDREQERYDQLYAELEDEARAEHDREFGSAIQYKPDGVRIHSAVMAKMK